MNGQHQPIELPEIHEHDFRSNVPMFGPIIQFALDNPKQISFISFQPVSFTGRDEEISDERRRGQDRPGCELADGDSIEELLVREPTQS